VVFRLIRAQWIIRTRSATLKALGAAKLRLASTWRLNAGTPVSRIAVFQISEQPEVCNETRMEDFATVGVAADKRAAGERLRVTM
jgi:hypothetical protein